MTAVTLGVLCLGWCRSRGIESDAVREWESAVDSKGVALGRWTTLVEAVGKIMAEHPGDPVARNIRLAAEATLPRLDGFVPTRNVFAHGGKPRLVGDVEDAGVELTDRVSVTLNALEPLTHVRLAVVHRLTPASADQLSDVDLDMAQGFAELFPTRRLRARVIPSTSDRSSRSATPVSTWP
jgi:hypothetical protein